MDKIILDMFTLNLPVVEKILRTIIIYAALIVGLRLAGKRELAQLNPFDLVVLLTISNTVQNAIIGDDNSVTGGVIGVATLLLLNYVVVRFVYSNHRIEKIIEGEEDVLISSGKINEANLRRETISTAELEIAAHRQGFSSLAEVERAVLEPGGGIAFSALNPTPDLARHQELLLRIDSLSQEVAQLRSELSKKP
jgi:uncharacterized membrane protein YcaP (DUF421 family)